MPDDARWDNPDPLEAAAETPLKLQRFAESELITCDACARPNAPTRSACIYCGAGLATAVAPSANSSVEASQTAATSDAGVILAVSDVRNLTGDQIERLSSLIHIEESVLRAGSEAGGPLPLMRPGTVEEGVRLSAELSGNGLQIVMVSDEELNAINPFRKIRGLEFDAQAITALPKAETDRRVLCSDVVLVVAGRVVTSRVEVEEKRHRKGTQPVDSRQFMTDESVMDIYTGTSQAPWRVYANAFDFSCLGPGKRLTGFENFAALIRLIQDRMTNGVVDASYHRKRAVLGNVWPIDSADTSELRLAGRGKLNVSNVTTSDNEAQFNRYSALAWHFRTKAEVAGR